MINWGDIQPLGWRIVPFGLPPTHHVVVTISDVHEMFVIGRDQLIEADIPVIVVTDGDFTARHAVAGAHQLSPADLDAVGRRIFENQRRPVLVDLERQAYAEDLLRDLGP